MDSINFFSSSETCLQIKKVRC